MSEPPELLPKPVRNGTQSSSQKYIPQKDDYVVWDKGIYGKDEGWVYFYDDAYITIETHCRKKSEEDMLTGSPHQYIHTLLLCYAHYWHELTYIKHRRNESKK